MLTDPEFTTGTYLWRRIVPMTALCVAVGLAVGWFRATVVAMPGLFGMGAGLTTGWLFGVIQKNDPKKTWTCRYGILSTLAAAVVFESVGALAASFFHAGQNDGTFDWLAGVLAGRITEGFFSAGHVYIYRGGMTGGWWLAFVLLDGLLFAFLFIVSAGVGRSPEKKPRKISAAL